MQVHGTLNVVCILLSVFLAPMLIVQGLVKIKPKSQMIQGVINLVAYLMIGIWVISLFFINGLIN